MTVHDEGAVSTARPSRPVRLVIWYQRTFAGGAPTCRFYPSCSSYAREALEVHGTRRGLWLTIRRLVRCRPFGPSGVDPVPLPRVGSVRSDDPLDAVDPRGPVSPDVTGPDRDRPEPTRKAS